MQHMHSRPSVQDCMFSDSNCKCTTWSVNATSYVSRTRWGHHATPSCLTAHEQQPFLWDFKVSNSPHKSYSTERDTYGPHWATQIRGEKNKLMFSSFALFFDKLTSKYHTISSTAHFLQRTNQIQVSLHA